MVIDFENSTVKIEETTGRVVLNTEDESGSGLRRGDDEEYLSDAGIENASLSTKLDTIGQSIGGIGQSLGGGVGGAADGADPFGGMAADIGAGAFSDPFLASMQSGGLGGPSRYRGARFQPLPGNRGEPRDLEGDSIFLRAYTPHEPGPREDGKAYVYFFPGGVTEHSVIQLSDGDERVYSVEIHPLSGRSIVHTFEFEPEEDLDELMEDEE